ncbi:MAG: hypothetical protein A2508_00160 [Candidatus Lambdaproteobacteria bacterium RIFOXYD12_FULL_49_8]|uniref:Cytidylate kinase n=1 Tax=Candidatus Lambdaproteobacteria bacterium RIFOXYD2_FULL_50_16 TaxID=1817772 RepID=A0A1F6G5K9_9PROT|nr:MAG: hypothetical protein A2527_01625 [Candidatus Lambdaproteobacteria bacterium RIFOXYD2_FULL_50_16]OGG97969.1 MAG: hypothetical protein A2508_00160 [Candidatus Lambdaproteobacteria bacterium RIFOXYD12_FULL_49_8]
MHFNILPSVDQRIHTWMQQQDKLTKSDKDAKFRFSITLSREFGCEAYPLALALKEKLEAHDPGHQWTIFDRALIDQIMVDNNISRSVLEKFGTKNVFYDSLLSNLDPHWTSDSEVYELMVKTILSLAEAGRGIFVGRGASVITSEMKRCFHFRLIADKEWRIESLMSRGEMTREEVSELMQEREKERERFINRFLGVNINAAENYHLVINNGKSSVEEMARTVIHHSLLHMDNLVQSKS